MPAQVDNINPQVLRECRKQMRFRIKDVAKKVWKVAAFEAAQDHPTFAELDTLAELYRVPRWVFIADELPAEYRFAQAMPAFRKFAESDEGPFVDPKVRGLVAEVERFRNLILDLQTDGDDTIPSFRPPSWPADAPLTETAQAVRDWLGVDAGRNLPFTGTRQKPGWKEKLEARGVFVFMTDKYRGWSHIDKDAFRGLAIHHDILPIIIVNDSDAKKAQSFTLFHELGHLMRRENAIDDCAEPSAQVEKLCDRLAAEVLMPRTRFLPQADGVRELAEVKRLAGRFKISPSACLVRLEHLGKISRAEYVGLEAERKEEYETWRKQASESEGGPARNRVTDALKQYGRIYAGTLFQAYHNEEITLHKLCKAFELKRPSQVLELEGRL